MEDSVQLALKLLREAFKGSEFKEFYDGDPDLIPTFNLPCLIVEQTADTTEKYSVASDAVTETLVVKVIRNKADDWKPNVDPLNLTHLKIRRAIGGRDATTGRYLPNTVKGALSVGVWGPRRIGRGMTVEIGVQPRPAENGEELVTAEGHVTIQIEYSVNV